ncbi:MAG: glycoside hydrolase family 30 beta sandwich domain-containing protein, partial [Myxococcota bacterium]
MKNWYDQPCILLNPSVTYQTLIGFGGAFTESAAWTLQHLPESAQDQVLSAYFHPTQGLGYTLARTHINSCDFSLGNWACADVADDWELEHFNMERTERHVLPMIQRAQRVPGAVFKMMASPWSPPAWMKTNGQMNHGGQLKPEARSVWAQHYVRWIQEMQARDVPIWAITVQNEPAATQVWDSCVYSAEEERDFVRDHLGPALATAGLQHVNLIIWDHNRSCAYERGAVVYEDAEAAGYVWGLGLHWYGGDFFGQLDQLHHAFPHKHIVFTEGCWEGGVKLGQWDRGARYAHHIIGDLNHHCEAWCDWNMVLDHTGGPNHVGNLCDAPVIVDTRTGEVHYQSSFWYIGHFSRFIRPGAKRIGHSYNGGALETVSVDNVDGSRVTVVHNPSAHSITY